VNARWLGLPWAAASIGCLLTRPLDSYGRGADDAPDSGVVEAGTPACELDPLAFVKVAEISADPTGLAAAGDVAWVLTDTFLGRYEVRSATGLADETRIASNLGGAQRAALTPGYILFQQTDPAARQVQSLFRVPREARSAATPVKVRTPISGPMGTEGERVYYATVLGVALTLSTESPPDIVLAFETTGAPQLLSVGKTTVATLAVLKGETENTLTTTSTLVAGATPPQVVARTSDVAALVADGPRVVVVDTRGDLKAFPSTGGPPSTIGQGFTGARALAVQGGFIYVVTDTAVVRVRDADGCRASVSFVARQLVSDGASVWATSGRALYRAATPP